MDMDIRKATNADVGSIVEIHKAAFEKFFFNKSWFKVLGIVLQHIYK
jgi:tagatose-1,6-bisphosphate aldolase non-catalytic subunit AgaZ/GatZ